MIFGEKKYDNDETDVVYYPAWDELCTLSEAAEGKNLALIIGVGLDTFWLRVAKKSPDFYFVLTDKNEDMFDRQIDYCKRENVTNYGLKLTPDKLPFSDGLFKRVESHYVLTYPELTKDKSEREVKKIMKGAIEEYLRVLREDGVLSISGEFRLADMDGLKRAQEGIERMKTVFPALKGVLKDKKREGYHIGRSEVSLSRYSSYPLHRESNLTYFVSKGKDIIEEDFERIKETHKEASLEFKI